MPSPADVKTARALDKRLALLSVRQLIGIPPLSDEEAAFLASDGEGKGNWAPQILARDNRARGITREIIKANVATLLSRPLGVGPILKAPAGLPEVSKPEPDASPRLTIH